MKNCCCNLGIFKLFKTLHVWSATLLFTPQSHVGKIYHLTGPLPENMHFYAHEHSKTVGR